jgi:hypothetical protein
VDLAEAGFAGAAAKRTGRPGYAPKALPKLYIKNYAPSNRTFSHCDAA